MKKHLSVFLIPGSVNFVLSMRAFNKSHWRLVSLNWCSGNNLLSPAIVKIEWKEPALQSVCGRDFFFG